MTHLEVAVPLWAICVLLLAMALKHYGADFVVQTTWIARGKERDRGWAAPLAVHVACHAGITLAIALAIAPRLWWLALVDLVIHAVIDRGKTLIAQRGKWETRDVEFWWLLGFDQFLHQATNVGLVAAFFLL